MKPAKAIIKSFFPKPIWEQLRRLRGELGATWNETLDWTLNPTHIRNAIRLRRFKNAHQGERCFIIGNGPSLQKMDLTPLANEITFGLNRIYLLFNKLGFQTTYYVSVNRLVIEQCAAEIDDLKMPKFLSWHSRDILPGSANTIFLRDPYRPATDGRFSKNIASWICEGATVTFVAMQIAYHMGFSEVVLIGVDHNFVTKGEPHKAVVSTGADPNHFDPAYFGKGFRWQLPDLETSELAYKTAKQAFEADGRTIVDATVGGKLQVFPKVDYADFFR